MPTGPAPITATVWSRPMPMSLWPQMASQSGSVNVACAGDSPAGILNRPLHAICGIATYSA